MKKYYLLLFAIIAVMALYYFLQGCFPETLADAISGATKPRAEKGNSLFHQTTETSLNVGSIRVEGEIAESGVINLDNHYKREVFVKESLFDKDEGIIFIGAYRYCGYSLFDLLHPFNLQKKNAEIFRPITDLYVVVENVAGETVVFSWSEIFHTNSPHQIIIATESAPIVPYRKEVNYETGNTWKVVAANDLFSYRILVDPVKITVHSFDKKEYAINRDMEHLYSPDVRLVIENKNVMTISQVHDQKEYMCYYSSFYGMGMGYHPAKFFQGPLLQKVLGEHINPFDREMICNGLVCFAGADGYRAIYSFSELFNRTDQVFPILAVPENPNESGFYRIFHPSDFYADRSVKSLAEVYFFQHIASQ